MDNTFFSDKDKKQTNDLEIYTPEIKKEKVLDINGSDYESELDSVMDQDGFIKTKLNEEVIIQRISHDLYKDATSGLRELYNNEVRACQIAKEKFNQKPYIKVSLNEISRKLIIQGFNSQGITEKVFTKVLLVLGNSGNLDRKKIGKFGMGFASYTTLSDIMLVETSCIEKNDKGVRDCYAVMAKGGLGFQKLPKPRLENTGTRLSMTLREKIDYDSLIKTLCTLAYTSGIETYFELQTKEENKSINGFKSGIHKLEQITYRDMFEKMNNDENLSYIKTSLVNDNIEIYLSLSANRSGTIINSRDKKIFLCNSPITAKLDDNDHDTTDNYQRGKIDEIEFDSLVVNLKDEEIFKPMPERERLTKEAEDKLKEIIINLYNNAIKEGIKPCHTIEEWYNNEQKNFILTDEESFTNKFDDKTKKLSELLNLDVFEHNPETKKTKYENTKLKNLLPRTKTINTNYLFYIEKRDKRINRLLDDFRPNNFLVVLNPNHYPYKNKEDRYKNAIKLIESFTFNEARQYLKDHKVKAKRSRISNGKRIQRDYDEISIHQTVRSDRWYDSNRLKDEITTVKINSSAFNDYKNSIIMVKPFADYKNVLREIQSNLCLTVEKKDLNEGLKNLDDIEKELSQITFNTNFGKIPLSEILKFNSKNDKIELNNYYCDGSYCDKNKLKIDHKLKALRFIPKEKNGLRLLQIVDHANNLFKLALILKKNKVNYTIHNTSLDNYYASQVEQLSKRVKLHYDDQNKLLGRDFEDIFEYENYLNTLKNLEDNVKNKTLLKLFQLSKSNNNFKEIANDVLRLDKNCS